MRNTVGLRFLLTPLDNSKREGPLKGGVKEEPDLFRPKVESKDTILSLLGAFYYTRRSIMVITSACGAEDESSILFGRIPYLKIFSYHVIIYYKVKKGSSL